LAYVSEKPRELTTATEAVAAIVPTALQEETMALLRSIISREARGSLSPRSAQLLMQRLLPPLEPARIVQPVNLDDIPTPSSPKQYRAALRKIFRAAVDGQCSLDDARKAMILTKTVYRAECEVAASEAVDRHHARA
jgi:hypothetical protein